MKRSILITTALLSLSACGDTLSRLDNVGKAPAMSKVENPNETPDYKPLSWPLPTQEPPSTKYANSLWQPGARAFFRDQRANRVGDILRVNIKLQDKAELNNATDRARDSSESIAAPKVFGLENRLGGLTPGSPDPTKLFDITGATTTKGNGQIKRKETIETQVAALVTQKLPNGNMVISGKQEIRVNYELREVGITGVIRPEDIRSDNSIDYSQVAEARIIYGGRGQVTDLQQPRTGTQLIDILSPF